MKLHVLPVLNMTHILLSNLGQKEGYRLRHTARPPESSQVTYREYFNDRQISESDIHYNQIKDGGKANGV